MVKIGCVLMAAGQGTRFGGDKLLQPLGGRPLLARTLSRLPLARLDRAAAVVFGPFTSCRNAYREDYGPLELLRDFFAEYPKPVIANVRSAHCMPMVTLPLGACCQVDGGRGALTVFRK